MRYDKKNKIIYYNDVYNDDFGEIGLERPKIPENYQYIQKNPFIKGLFTILYYGVAYPILYVLGKCMASVKIKDKKNLKEIKKCGYYIYGNHTHWVDAWVGSVYLSFPKRVEILGFPDALSIPVAKHLVKGLGLLPVENGPKSLLKLTEAIKYHIDKKHVISIYPEAHIWPYYNGVRPVKDVAFKYPSLTRSPIVAICTIYRKVWYSKKPKMTIYVSKPIYYDENLSKSENTARYYNYFVDFLNKTHEEHQSVEYIEYIKENN